MQKQNGNNRHNSGKRETWNKRVLVNGVPKRVVTLCGYGFFNIVSGVFPFVSTRIEIFPSSLPFSRSVFPSC
jgi:hypothetical protein